LIDEVYMVVSGRISMSLSLDAISDVGLRNIDSRWTSMSKIEILYMPHGESTL